jgi:hypothetical protein
MARRVSVECCGCCGKPIRQYDTEASHQCKFLDRVEFVKIEVETIRGGGGWPKQGRSDYQSGPGIRLWREDVCGECYDEIQALLEPIRQLLDGRRRRQEHHISPMRDNEPSSDGRGPAILRALPFFRRAIDAR